MENLLFLGIITVMAASLAWDRWLAHKEKMAENEAHKAYEQEIEEGKQNANQTKTIKE